MCVVCGFLIIFSDLCTEEFSRVQEESMEKAAIQLDKTGRTGAANY